MLTDEDIKKIRKICREEAVAAQVSRPGLYLMVITIYAMLLIGLR